MRIKIKMRILILVVGLLAVSVSASVIGIDFGTEFLKVSLISPGKSFVIIENTTTKRKTENAISFYNKERFYESEATNKRTRVPRNTFVFLNKFLGALANDQEIIRISKENFEDYVFELDQGRGTFAFKLENFVVDLKQDETDTEGNTDPSQKEFVLRVEDLVGMILKYSNTLVKKQFGQNVTQCVITVPAAWTLNQRSALK